MDQPPESSNGKREIPAWLLGLVIAAILFVVVFLVFQALGFGDNPVVDGAVSVISDS